jgi:thiamine-phosphate pyrophosphorylase
MNLRGLYAITPEVQEAALLESRVRAALTHAPDGWAALQYRSKVTAPDLRLEQARRLAALARERGVRFLVNDDVELALAVDADGVHLGREDGDLAQARRRLRGRILGASCYDSLDAARSAVAAGADYVAFGSVFPSGTKPGAVRAPLDLFGQARALGVPLVAIGGITLANAPQVLAAGADALAVIADLFEAGDIAARARALAGLFAAQSPA